MTSRSLTSRYPRRNHRLAPATLRGLLQARVPAKYLQGLPSDSLRLCELDESAWQRFPEDTCRKLGEEVVREVSRAIRMSPSVGDRRLPPLPQGMRLTDLELEARTLKCLAAAGLHRRPRDLRTMTVEGILSLRGFWVKSLVDLLTSLEYVNDHPESRRRLQTLGSATTAVRVASRYPRRNHPLAPRVLHEILTEPILPELVEGTPFAGRRLCDLDRSVWEYLSPETIARLADQILWRVAVGGYSQTVQQRKLPGLPQGLRLEDVPLENRTYNCLRREGYGRRPEDLAGRTVGDLLSIKAFGAKCLVDLLTSLESLAPRGAQLNEKLAAAATALANDPAAMGIHFSDPRLGPWLRAADNEADTVADLVGRLLRRRADPPDAQRVYEHICRVLAMVEELPRLTLEEELITIFLPSPCARDREILAGYYGWDGGGGLTLEELGRRHGLSRERVRQICGLALRRSRRAAVFAPVLDRALAFLSQRVPKTVDALQAEFDAAKFSVCGLSVEAVHRAAGFLGRDPGFALVTVGDARLAVRSDCAELPRAIVHAARRAVFHSGAAAIHDILAELAARYAGRIDRALVLETLTTLKDVVWLDETRGWFQLQVAPQHGLAVMVRKILAVTGRIRAGQLRAAILRHRRTPRNLPPVGILLEICRRLPGVRVEGNTIVAEDRRNWETVLGNVERAMVRVLTAYGPVLERSEFEDRCLSQGVNRFSFNAIVMSSPLIVQHGRSMYGLLGAKIDRKSVRSLAAHKAGGANVKVLRGSGHTDNGQFYLAYRLSRAAVAGGVITIPSAMKDQLKGHFAIRTPDGQQAGSLVAKNGCAWGLGPVLRARHAKSGDHLVIVFDVHNRLAVAHLGDPQALESVLAMKQTTCDA